LGSLGGISLHRAQKAGLALRPRALLYPLVSVKHIEGPLGSVVDSLCFLAVVAGTVGPIGFLGVQLGSLLESLFSITSSLSLQAGLIAFLTLFYSFSAVSGVAKGMKWLSQLNIVLSVIIGVFVFLYFSPVDVIVQHFKAQALMLKNFIPLSLKNQGDEWMLSWTWFYWSWFIGYAPMMSVIVTRLSKGRSLRQIILTVSLVCPLVTNIWFSFLGGSLFHIPNFNPTVLERLGSEGLPAALTSLVLALPLTALSGFLVCILIFTFLATTGDSVSFSLSMASSQKSDPPKKERLFWSLSMGLLALVLLLSGGNKPIAAFQNIIILTAIPVTLIMSFPLVNGCRELLLGTFSKS
ncbi:MAG: BCCT family transporter, partial [Bdellovibrionales bacterium]|nr:BCCT family transporter [Bdellovibrionales bacterium]